MQRLKNWTARRAATSLTIYGVDADTDKPVKLTGIDRIEQSRQTTEGSGLRCPLAFWRDLEADPVALVDHNPILQEA